VLVGVSAILRLPGVTAMAAAAPSAGMEMTKFAKWLSTVSFGLFGLALLVALAWIAARKRRMLSWVTTVAMALALAGTWVARAVDLRATPPVWQLFVARMVDGLVLPPESIFTKSADRFVALLALLLAGAAFTRRQRIPAVAGVVALILTAGVGVDQPARALILLMASLGAVLASRDDVGMWETLLGKKLEPSAVGASELERTQEGLEAAALDNASSSAAMESGAGAGSPGVLIPAGPGGQSDNTEEPEDGTK